MPQHEALAQIKLSEEQAKRLKTFLTAEINRAEHARVSQLAQYRIDDDFYDAKPVKKTFPFPGCSNARIPAIRIACDSVSGRIRRAIEDPRPAIWTVNSFRADHVPVARSFQRFIDAVALHPREMNMRDMNRIVIPRMVRRGSAPIKVLYTLDERPDRFYNRDGEIITVQNRTLTNASTPTDRPHERFLLPPEARSIESAAWVADIVDLTSGQIRARETQKQWMSGVFEAVKGHPLRNILTPAEEAAAKRLGVSATAPPSMDAWRFHEVHLRYDVFDDGQDWDIVCVYHLDTQTIARLIYKPHAHRMRPFVNPVYRVSDMAIAPAGLARQLRQLNIALDTVVNQFIDAGTLANAPIFLSRTGEPGLMGGVEIFPGVHLELSNLDNFDIRQFEARFSQNPVIINLIQQFMERDSGMSDPQLGMQGALKSAVPATSTLAILQQGNTKLDDTIGDLRGEYSRMGYMALSDYQQFNPETKVINALSPEEAEQVASVFEMPIELIRDHFQVELTATTAALDRQTKLQNSFALMQAVGGYYSQVLALGQQLVAAETGAPQFVPVIAKVLEKSADAFLRTLDNFNIADAEEFVVRPELILGRARGTEEAVPDSSPIAGVADAAALGPLSAIGP